MKSHSLVTLHRYICRHRAPRMREIFGHVTAVIRRIAHACVATWQRVTVHASLVLQSTGYSSCASSFVSPRTGEWPLTVTCSRQAGRVQPYSAVSNDRRQPRISANNVRASTACHLAISHCQITESHRKCYASLIVDFCKSLLCVHVYRTRNPICTLSEYENSDL